MHMRHHVRSKKDIFLKNPYILVLLRHILIKMSAVTLILDLLMDRLNAFIGLVEYYLPERLTEGRLT